LQNVHVLRYAYYSSLRRTETNASILMIARAVPLAIFEQPVRANEYNYYVLGGVSLLLVCCIFVLMGVTQRGQQSKTMTAPLRSRSAVQ
jgi:hypothetical protein